MKRSGFLRVSPDVDRLTVKVPRKPKTRKCKVCPETFTVLRSLQRVCGPKCAQEDARIKREKAEREAAALARKEQAAALLAARPRKWWLKKAKTAMHAYVRARDEGKSCISCDTILVKRGRVGGDYDAGHFLSVGCAKHLEFEIKNIFGQCKHCNDHLKGNQVAYQARLVERFGQGYVDALRADQASRHLTIEDFKAIEAEYKAKTKLLLQQKEAASAC